MREIQACNAHSFLNQFVQDVDRGTGRACGCVRERRGSVDTLRGCLFFFNVAICSFFSRELFVATFLINSSNGAGIPSSLTPPLLNNGANYLAPPPPSSPPLFTYDADYVPAYPLSCPPRVQMMPVFRITLGRLPGLGSSRQRCSRCVLASWASI